MLGIDGDAMHVVAAKEMKDKGQLEYRPVLRRRPAAVADDNEGANEAVQQALGDVCVARVADNCDRDNVRCVMAGSMSCYIDCICCLGLLQRDASGCWSCRASMPLLHVAVMW